MKVGINGAVHDISDLKVGVSGAVRAVSEANIGVAGAVKKVWPIGPGELNDCTWEEISKISSAGMGENYWEVGDRKQITLNGTVGSLSLTNYSTYAFIIGFNHNSNREGSGRIHFQLSKTALSGGTDICLCDSSYLSTGSSTAFRMNTTNTNSGGWESSYMRNNICGTSKTNYSGTIIAIIPDTLRATLKSVTKYTNNEGQLTNTITSTTDYFFLFSEYEIYGNNTYANSNEANYQQQYVYYSAGNSKIKYKHNETSTAARWWLRSPNASSYEFFLNVTLDGTAMKFFSNANYSLGFAPGFCV